MDDEILYTHSFLIMLLSKEMWNNSYRYANHAWTSSETCSASVLKYNTRFQTGNTQSDLTGRYTPPSCCIDWRLTYPLVLATTRPYQRIKPASWGFSPYHRFTWSLQSRRVEFTWTETALAPRSSAARCFLSRINWLGNQWDVLFHTRRDHTTSVINLSCSQRARLFQLVDEDESLRPVSESGPALVHCWSDVGPENEPVLGLCPYQSAIQVHHRDDPLVSHSWINCVLIGNITSERSEGR